MSRDPIDEAAQYQCVRNSLSTHPYWYQLCDRYGLYMIDEANIGRTVWATVLLRLLRTALADSTHGSYTSYK